MPCFALFFEQDFWRGGSFKLLTKHPDLQWVLGGVGVDVEKCPVLQCFLSRIFGGVGVLNC